MNAPRQFDVIFEPQEDGGFTAYVPDLPGCISEGDTLEEATEMIRDAMRGYLDSLRDRGYELPEVQHRKVAPA
jgi:predicted RNase H-like HicB family nuclease